jgi:hypothetical protein
VLQTDREKIRDESEKPGQDTGRAHGGPKRFLEEGFTGVNVATDTSDDLLGIKLAETKKRRNRLKIHLERLLQERPPER